MTTEQQDIRIKAAVAAEQILLLEYLRALEVENLPYGDESEYEQGFITGFGAAVHMVAKNIFNRMSSANKRTS
jgi:hypothetical protein